VAAGTAMIADSDNGEGDSDLYMAALTRASIKYIFIVVLTVKSVTFILVLCCRVSE